jgi:hypothetical protein
MQAGGTGAAGGTAGGNTGGGVMAFDAGLRCANQAFCIFKQTQRQDFNVGIGVVGERLDEGLAVFSRYVMAPNATIGAAFVSHSNTGTGLASRITITNSPYVVAFGGSARDVLLVTESNLTTAKLRQFIDGGIPQTLYSGDCAGTTISLNSFDRIGNRVIIGGSNDGLCELNLETRTTQVIQPEVSQSPNTFVNDVYVTPGNEIFWVSSDGYVSKFGVGRVSPPLDTNEGLLVIDGIDGDNVWALGANGVIAQRMTDGGFAEVAKLSTGGNSMKVTADGVFVGTRGGIAYKTRFTDGGFEVFRLPIDPNQTVADLSGGPGALHAVGFEGSPAERGFFFSLQPRSE